MTKLPLWGLTLVCVVVFSGCSSNQDNATTSTETTLTSTPPSLTSLVTESSTTTTVAATTTTTLPIAERAMPETQGALIVAFNEAEEAIRDISIENPEATQWGRRQQRLYRVLSNSPDWAPHVVAGVNEDVQFGVQSNWGARLALSSLVRSGPLAETLPAWQLREPLPVDELMGYYREAEAQTGIPWNYLAAINLIETRMGRIEGFSTAGATGPMQFLPTTWEECCEGDPTVDRDAIIGAGNFLVRVGGLEDMQKALYRYNNSDRYVNAVTFYAEVMADNELAYRGYHAWQVYFLSAAGLILMPSDYYEPEPVPVDEWLAKHPEALVGTLEPEKT